MNLKDNKRKIHMVQESIYSGVYVNVSGEVLKKAMGDNIYVFTMLLLVEHIRMEFTGSDLWK